MVQLTSVSNIANDSNMLDAQKRNSIKNSQTKIVRTYDFTTGKMN